MKIVILIAIIINECLSTSDIAKRLKDANRTLLGQFPFVGYLKLRIGENWLEAPARCTVSLLQDNLILAAGHCFCHHNRLYLEPKHYYVTFGSVNVRSGATKMQTSSLSEIYIHESFIDYEFNCNTTHCDSTLHYDVAMAKLKYPMTLGPYVNTIELSKKHYDIFTAYLHAGFGCIKSEDESNTWKQLCHSQSQITRIYKGHFQSSSKSSAFPSCILEGDSGGPAFLEEGGTYVQIGVTICVEEWTWATYVASDAIYAWVAIYRALEKAHRAQFGEFPFIGYLTKRLLDVPDRWTGKPAVCTVSLLKNNFILTAAHCFCDNGEISTSAFEYFVTFGSINDRKSALKFQSSQLAQIYIHESYENYEHKCDDYPNFDKTKIDIAVARIRRPMNLGPYVNTIELSRKQYDAYPVIHAGFSRLTETKLNFVNQLYFYNVVICRREGAVLRNKPYSLPYRTESQRGDSGGLALVKVGDKFIQIGINVFLTPLGNYYFSSSDIYDWISQYIH